MADRDGSGIAFDMVAFGSSRSFSAIAATFPDGRRWVVSGLQASPGPDLPDRARRQLMAEARRMAAAAECHRFLPEMLAYVRSLPEGQRSPSFDGDEVPADAAEDVRHALVLALQRTDPFRAAVAFESRVPYLVADRGLVESMDAILASFDRDYDQVEWAAAAAEEAEAELCSKSPFVQAHVAALKSGESSPPAR